MLAMARGLDRRFDDLAPGIRIRKDKVGWPNEEEVSGQTFNGNNLYMDLRGKSWRQAERAFQIEQSLFGGISGCRTAERQQVLLRRIWKLEQLFDGLDIGTVAAVYAISAAGGIPVTSCNAGCFGGSHREPFPVVGFWWPRSNLPLLRECAKQAQISLWLHHRGELVAGSRTIRRMSAFAAALLERRERFQELGRIRRPGE
jgi:hypothetical protein